MNTGKKTYLAALILLVALFLASCQHDTDVFDGPSLNDRFGEFELRDSLEASQPSVDFSTGETVFFTASFSKRIAWVLRITGKESGAVKLIEGFENELNTDNSLWNGTTTELPLFRLEDCLVELIIPEEDSLTLTTEVSLTGNRVYEGNLVTDFEENLGSRLFFGNFEFELTGETGIRNDIPAGQGENFFFFEGTDNVVANFFTGLIRIFPESGQTYFNLPTTVPENAYFNFFLYGDLTPHTIAVVQLFTDTNGNGRFDDGADRSFQLSGDFPVDFEGWKQVSFTMEDIGMSEQEASELVGIQVLLISNMNAQPNPPTAVRFGIDYLVFTANQPLQL
ncbi:MAG: hypothetical protein MRZ79_19380 [Bacteroidia bacterium]|nr:hypothetical protein [Bacteroidia bacterium]